MIIDVLLYSLTIATIYEFLMYFNEFFMSFREKSELERHCTAWWRLTWWLGVRECGQGGGATRSDRPTACNSTFGGDNLERLKLEV